jgi:predicted nucleotidyltransferase
MIQLFEEALQLQRELEHRGWPFCFIGGIALQHWGEPRTTRDLDLSLFTGFGGEAGIVDALLQRYPGRIPDARAFALQHRVLLLVTQSGVPVDIALAALPFEAELIARSTKINYGPGIDLRICALEDLVVMKAFADRPQDRADLVGIVHRRGDSLDWPNVFERLSPLADAKDAPDILDRLAALR